jgi:hypothetical protein
VESETSIDNGMTLRPLVGTRLPRGNSIPVPTTAVAVLDIAYGDVGAVQQYTVAETFEPLRLADFASGMPVNRIAVSIVVVKIEAVLVSIVISHVKR